MKSSQKFPFEKARRISAAEVEAARAGIAAKLGAPRRARRGRPPKPAAEKAEAVSIRLSPVVLTWAKREAKKKGTGYQTFINQTLAKLADRPQRHARGRRKKAV